MLTIRNSIGIINIAVVIKLSVQNIMAITAVKKLLTSRLTIVSNLPLPDMNMIRNINSSIRLANNPSVVIFKFLNTSHPFVLASSAVSLYVIFL